MTTAHSAARAHVDAQASCLPPAPAVLREQERKRRSQIHCEGTTLFDPPRVAAAAAAAAASPEVSPAAEAYAILPPVAAKANSVAGVAVANKLVAAPIAAPTLSTADLYHHFATDMCGFIYEEILTFNYLAPQAFGGPAAHERPAIETAEYDAFLAWPREVQTLFAVRLPAISLLQYLERFLGHLRCSPEAYVLAVIFVQRLARTVGLPVSPRSIHRVLLACLVLGIKMRDDHYFTMRHYAQIGGVSLSDLVQMELAVFTLLGFDCTIRNEEYAAAVCMMRAAGQRRDRVSYGLSVAVNVPVVARTWEHMLPVVQLSQA